MQFALFDFLDDRGRNIISEWTRELQKPERARLDQKLDMLQQVGNELPPKLLADSGVRHIKKLRINGRVALRPMLCKGPIENDQEFTLLCGAQERDRRLIPPDAVQQAALNRHIVIEDPERRCFHGRIK